jgi:tetratricopeptide (TPR) repeat protein
MINKKILFQFSFGLFLFLISTFNYCIYWINYNYSSKGEFVTLKIRDAIWEDDGFFLNPVFNKTESIVKVEQNVCFKVDSIDFRIDKGFFGFKILSNNAIIIPNKYCDNRLCKDSTTKDYETYFNNGQELTKIRCYYQAICEFNKAIKLNKTESKTYYYRGTSFLALQNYKSELIDFYIALEIEKAKNSETEIEQAFKENPYKLVSSILTDLESNNLSKIESLDIEGKLNKIQLANKFDNYTTRINYCIKKLKKTR